MHWPWSRKPKGDAIPDLLKEADRACKAGNLKKAIRCYLHVLSLDGRNLPALINLAAIYSQNPKNLPKSVAMLEKAGELDPGNPTLLLNLGAVYAYMNRYDEALICFNKLEEKAPEYPGLYYNRANLYFRMGRTRDAFVEIQQAVRLNPKDLNALILQETLKRKIEKEDGREEEE